MPSSLIDSAVFRDIFSTAAMRGVFSDENRVQKYLDFEAALARAQARLGIIPKEAAEEICREVEREFARLIAALEPTPHDGNLDLGSLYGENLISGVTAGFK